MSPLTSHRTVVGIITNTVAAAASLLVIALPAPASAAPGYPAAEGRCVDEYALGVLDGLDEVGHRIPDGAELASPAETEPAGYEDAEEQVPTEAPSFGVFFLFAFLFVGLGAIGFALSRASGNRDGHSPPVRRSTVLSPPHHFHNSSHSPAPDSGSPGSDFGGGSSSGGGASGSW